VSVGRDQREVRGRWRGGLAALAISAVVFGACSGGGAATTAPSAAPASPTAAASSAAPATAAPSSAAPSASGQQFAGQTLNVLVTPYHADWDAKLAPAFEAATGAKVNFIYLPFDGMQAKLAAVVAAKDNSFDLVWAPVTYAPSFAGTLYADIESKLPPALVADLTSKSQVNGKGVYAVPVADTSVLFAWNKDQYKTAGLDPEKAPTTFEELFAQCDALKKAFPDKYCFDWNIPNGNGSFSFWTILLNAAGGTMWSDDLKSVAFNTPEGLAAMQTFYQFMFVKKYADPASWVLPDQFVTGDRFAAGTLPTAFLFDLQWTTMEDATKSKVVGKVGWSIIPGIGGHRSGTINGWEGYAVSNFAKSPDLAVAYLEYLVSADAQVKLAKLTGLVPVLKSVLTDPSYKTPTSAVTAEQYQYSTNRWGAGYYSDVADASDPILHQLARGEITPQAALDAFAKSAQAKIDAYYAR
jgi:multiple sugar transport system substrate-binding protein